MNSFKEIKTKDLNISAFDLKNKWMLVTRFETGWYSKHDDCQLGWFGYLWNKEVVFVFIRPQRFTKRFVDASDSFTLTFFADEYKKRVRWLISVSIRRDEDKTNQVLLWLRMRWNTLF